MRCMYNGFMQLYDRSYAPTSLHRPGHIVNLPHHSVSTHELGNIEALVRSPQDLEGEVVRTAKW